MEQTCVPLYIVILIFGWNPWILSCNPLLAVIRYNNLRCALTNEFACSGADTCFLEALALPSLWQRLIFPHESIRIVPRFVKVTKIRGIQGFGEGGWGLGCGVSMASPCTHNASLPFIHTYDSTMATGWEKKTLNHCRNSTIILIVSHLQNILMPSAPSDRVAQLWWRDHTQTHIWEWKVVSDCPYQMRVWLHHHHLLAVPFTGHALCARRSSAWASPVETACLSLQWI